MSKTIRAFITLSILCTFIIQGSAQITLYADSSWTKPYEPFRVAGNLYYVGTYDLACYLIATPEGNVLINTGLPKSISLIKKNIETLGLNFSDIKILLTTQAHYDHMGAMAEIKKITGAKMMVHEGDAQVAEDGGNSDFIFGGKGPMFPPVKVDRVLHDQDVIEIGKTKISVLHHPGHTKGATSFIVDVSDPNRAWRVLIVNMPSILDETRIFGMPSYPNVGKDYAYTLESLKKLQFDLWVSSHASQFGLHEKRKEGDLYRPEVFGNLKEYDEAVKDYDDAYKKRKQKAQAGKE